MQNLARSCLVVFIGVAVLGCGGGAPPAGAASAGSAPPADGGVGKPDDSTAPTTTLALADGGDLQGAKLVETHTTTPPPATPPAAGPTKPAHGHDMGRTPTDIRVIIQAHRDDARACYDAGLKDHPGVEGDLVITWTIDPKGNVTQVSLDSTKSQIVEPGIVTCVSNVIRNIQFAESPGGFETRAFYPFNFHPHHGQHPAP